MSDEDEPLYFIPVQKLGPRTCPGDIVLAQMAGSHDVVHEMFVLEVNVATTPSHEVHHIEVHMTPVDADERIIAVYKTLMFVGEEFVFYPGEYYLMDSETRRRCDFEQKLDLGVKRRADAEAKRDAYADPGVAALIETPGRITRQKYYKSIGT